MRLLQGFAVDPTSTDAGIPKMIGVVPETGEDSKTVFEKIPKRPLDKRKREKNDKPEDIEGFLGPWGCFQDEQKVSKPTDVWLVPIAMIVLSLRK